MNNLSSIKVGIVTGDHGVMEKVMEAAEHLVGSPVALSLPSKKEDYKKLINTNSPDVSLVAPYNGTISVSAIRELVNEAQYKPFSGQNRVLIVKDAHEMSDESSNALLKTLEECDDSVHIYLVTQYPQRLSKTIQSRCNKFAATPAPTSLEDLVESLGLSMNEYKNIRRLGINFIKEVVYKDGYEAGAKARELKDHRAFINVLIVLLRDAWFLELGLTEERLIVNKDIMKELLDLSEDPISFMTWINALENFQFTDSFFTVNRKLLFDELVVGLTATSGENLARD